MIPPLHKITFHTKKLPICSGFLAEISEDVWEEVIGDLTSVIVIAEEQNWLQEMFGVVANNQGVSTVY